MKTFIKCNIRTYEITPNTKPRMTNADRRIPRKCVVKYWSYKASLRAMDAAYDVGQSILFIMPMPKSWSKKKKTEMDGKPHTQVPDIDNLEKAFFDAIFDEDKHIWYIGPTMKIWGYGGKILVGADEAIRIIQERE